MTATVRPYEASDRDVIVALWRRCGLLVPWNDPDRDIVRFLQNANSTLLVSEGDKGVVATAAVGHDGHRGWLYYVAVHPDRRRQGLGRQIVGAAEAWLETQGLAKAQLVARASNHAVTRFYARLGYHAAPRALMQKWLAPPPVTEFDYSEDGMLDLVATRLEMTSRPHRAPLAKPSGRLALLHAPNPPVSFFRYLYNTVGERWLWWERRAMSDDELAAILADDLVQLTVLYVEGVPAGFAELDLHSLEPDGMVDLTMIGLMPEYLGQGYGRYLLTWTIDAAWQREPQRIVTTVRSLDHPHGAAVLQRLGFAAVAQDRQSIEDPRLSGLIPPDVPLTATSQRPPGGAADAVVTPLPRRE